MSIITRAVRFVFGEGDERRDKNLTTPDTITRYDNILYGKDPVYQSLDIYVPKGTENQILPTIISVHGGGFVYGTKENYQFYCMDLATRGFKVVNFSYRLAPDNKFPAQIEDTNALFNWVSTNYEQYCLDINNLFAVGDSAGGNILALYSGLLSKPSLNEDYNFNLSLPDLKLKAIALNCGLYNPLKQNPLRDGSLTANLMKELFIEKGKKAEQEFINIENYIHKDYPPAFIMTCEDDFLKEQPRYLMKALEKRDIPFIYRFFSSKKDRLGHVFHLNLHLKESKICSDEECNFFKEFIQ